MIRLACLPWEIVARLVQCAAGDTMSSEYVQRQLTAFDSASVAEPTEEQTA